MYIYTNEPVQTLTAIGDVGDKFIILE